MSRFSLPFSLLASSLFLSGLHLRRRQVQYGILAAETATTRGDVLEGGVAPYKIITECARARWKFGRAVLTAATQPTRERAGERAKERGGNPEMQSIYQRSWVRRT